MQVECGRIWTSAREGLKRVLSPELVVSDERLNVTLLLIPSWV